MQRAPVEVARTGRRTAASCAALKAVVVRPEILHTSTGVGSGGSSDCGIARMLPVTPASGPAAAGGARPATHGECLIQEDAYFFKVLTG